MAKKRGPEGRVQGRGVLRKNAPRSLLYVDGVLDDCRDGVMFLLRRYLSVYLGSQFSTSCFNAFRPALFTLSVFYAI